MADAGTPMDGGHEGQESQHGEVPPAGLELVASISSLQRRFDRCSGMHFMVRSRDKGGPRKKGRLHGLGVLAYEYKRDQC